MYRYLALIWNASDTIESQIIPVLRRHLHASSTEWRSVVDLKGFALWHAGCQLGVNQAYSLGGELGAVLGRLFERDLDAQDTPRDVVFETSGALSITRSNGLRLIERYWGRYVAFVHDTTTSTTRVVRDPTGALPCFVTSHRGVNIVFSRVDDCLSLRLPAFSINWRYLRAHVPFQSPQLADTGLNEVQEVQPGECLELRPDGCAVQKYWDPFQICRTNVIEDPEQATVELRRTTTACIDAWASCYPNIIHTLSGGLDSSIVLSCLQQAPTRPAVTAINYYTTVPEGDERRFARLAARGGELIEHERDPSAIRLEAVLDIAKSCRPWTYLYYLEHGTFETQLAKKKNASAIFSGGGGDGLFYQAKTGWAAADYVHEHGVDRRLLRIALDAAHLERISVWSVLRNALRDGYSNRRWTPLAELRQYPTLVSKDALNSETEDYAHPWLKEASNVPPGKLWQILSTSVPSTYYDPFGSDEAPERVHPLVSQPLVELCLRIPTYVLTTGARDRAIARRAFSGRVPREIINRADKGGMCEHVKTLSQANASFIRDLLLDGQLVQQGLLDRPKLEVFLSGSHSVVSSEFTEIYDHISTEAWLRTWTDTARHTAAA